MFINKVKVNIHFNKYCAVCKYTFVLSIRITETPIYSFCIDVLKIRDIKTYRGNTK